MARQLNARLILNLFFVVFCFSQAQASESTVQCQSIFKHILERPLYDRGNLAPELDHTDPVQYIQEYFEATKWGVVRNTFDTELDTRIYYTATGIPYPGSRQTSLVDPDSRAVFIFFHGSGTMQSSGRNFYGIMNYMNDLGFSSIAIDLPFHSEGPIASRFYDADYFMNWIHKIVLKVKAYGKPVYLVGHSFGSDVVSEFAYRYPFEMESGVALSPAGFTSELEEWYKTKTSKMRFGLDTPTNQAAEIWAETVLKGFIWNKQKKGYTDPTILNPQLRLRMMSGDREEYVPGPIGGSSNSPTGKNTYAIGEAYNQFFAHATTTVEPGVGHFIFNHADENGHNVVYRELLYAAGFSPFQERELRKQRVEILDSQSPSERLSYLYAFDKIFQKWVDKNFGGAGLVNRIGTQQNEILAKKIFHEYETNRRYREREELMQLVLNYADHNAHFYESNLKMIEEVKKGKFIDALLFRYLEAVQSKSSSTR